jgi:hypothetical protein
VRLCSYIRLCQIRPAYFMSGQVIPFLARLVQFITGYVMLVQFWPGYISFVQVRLG